MTAIVRTVKDSGKYLADRYRISHCKVKVDSLNFEESGQNFGSMSKFWEEIEKKADWENKFSIVQTTINPREQVKDIPKSLRCRGQNVVKAKHASITFTAHLVQWNVCLVSCEVLITFLSCSALAHQTLKTCSSNVIFLYYVSKYNFSDLLNKGNSIWHIVSTALDKIQEGLKLMLKKYEGRGGVVAERTEESKSQPTQFPCSLSLCLQRGVEREPGIEVAYKHEHFRLSEQFQDCHSLKKKYIFMCQRKVRKFLDLGKIHLIF